VIRNWNHSRNHSGIRNWIPNEIPQPNSQPNLNPDRMNTRHPGMTEPEPDSIAIKWARRGRIRALRRPMGPARRRRVDCIPRARRVRGDVFADAVQCIGIPNNAIVKTALPDRCGGWRGMRANFERCSPFRPSDHMAQTRHAVVRRRTIIAWIWSGITTKLSISTPSNRSDTIIQAR
jgi:hypothetical protein